MDIPERSMRLDPPRAAWRWAANSATLCILGMGLLATAWRGAGLAAISIIVLAALMDGADGALARRAGGPTRVGALLDIVADLAAFGVAPAALARTIAPAGAWPLDLALGIYLLAALARLVRSAKLALSKPAGFYVGLPMPTAGFLVAGLALSLPALWVAVAVLTVSGLALSRRPYPSVPWMWQHRPASLLIFLVATAVVSALSLRAGLIFAGGVCAGYPWARPVQA